MIDYSSLAKFLQSDKYLDKTQYYEQFLWFRYETLTNCKGTGSSLLLKTFACFLDENANTKRVFSNLAIGNAGDFEKHVNSYRVLYLDFSDFDAKSYEQAKERIGRTMADAYKYFFSHFETNSDHLYSTSTFEHALDIIEGNVSDDVLQSSLRLLVLQLRGYEGHHKDKRLAVLIDNMVSLETVAAQYGYSAEMEKFLKAFLIEDVYKYCDIFLQISDIEEERESWWHRDRHLVYRLFCVSDFDAKDRYPEIIVPPDCQLHFDLLPYTPQTFDWNSIISNGRTRILQIKRKEEQRRLEDICHEKKRFAEELSPDIPLFSHNMGIRSKPLNKDSIKYKELNELVKKIHVHFHPKFNADKIYSYLQKVEESNLIVRKDSELESILEHLSEQNPKWKSPGWTSNTGCWIQVIYCRSDMQDNGSPAKPEWLKIYACLKNMNVEDVFLESLKYLLNHSDDDFAAKIATCNRSDQLCYWVSQNGFRALEDFYKPYSNDLSESLPFIAYRNRLGISKEFFGVDYSHNATVAHIIADYLRNVSDVEDVDLEKMFNNYIMKWNANIYEENDYGGFKNNTALSFVVILDSLDVILDDAEVNDDSSLVSGDRNIWQALAQSRCWADVNNQLIIKR